jgi:hypothetical protein
MNSAQPQRRATLTTQTRQGILFLATHNLLPARAHCFCACLGTYSVHPMTRVVRTRDASPVTRSRPLSLHAPRYTSACPTTRAVRTCNVLPAARLRSPSLRTPRYFSLRPTTRAVCTHVASPVACSCSLSPRTCRFVFCASNNALGTYARYVPSYTLPVACSRSLSTCAQVLFPRVQQRARYVLVTHHQWPACAHCLLILLGIFMRVQQHVQCVLLHASPVARSCSPSPRTSRFFFCLSNDAHGTCLLRFLRCPLLLTVRGMAQISSSWIPCATVRVYVTT